MRFLIFVLTLALFPALARAQIQAASEYDPFDPIEISVEHQLKESEKATALWQIEDPAQYLPVDVDTIHVWAPPRAELYQVTAIVWVTRTIEVDGETFDVLTGPPTEYKTDFRVRGQLPEPDPPKPDPDPPDPDDGDDDDPDPEPDDPDDQPSPFDEDGLQALILYETDDMQAYSKGQILQLYSRSLRSWAAENMLTENWDGKPWAALRIYDKDIVSEGVPDKWLSLVEDYSPQLQVGGDEKSPLLVAGNGTRGYVGPLPDTEAETIELLSGLK